MVVNIRELFLQSFRAANSELNLNEGFPVHDTMIAPNTRAFSNMTALLARIEERIDYSRFFDADGNLISEDFFDILSSNLFLGDGFASKGSGALLLEFAGLQNSIVIGEGLTVSREGVAFRIAPGTYSPPVHRVVGGRIRYAFTGVSIEIGSGVPVVSAGGWEVTAGSLPAECLQIVSEQNTVRGSGNAGVLTRDNLPLLMGRNTLDTVSAALNAVNTTAVSSGITPDKLTVAGYADPEYQSGIVPFQDEDDDVRVFRFGGYADIRFHRDFQIADVYFEDGVPLVEGQYRYEFDIPVYAVISAKTWIEGEDSTDVMYDMDYIKNRIITSRERVKVTVLTTDVTSYGHIRSEMAAMTVAAGSLRLLPYYSIRVYADEDCVPEGADTEPVNSAMVDFFSGGIAPEDFTFEDLKANIFDVTGVTLSKVKYILPDDFRGEIASGGLAGNVIPYGPDDLTVDIPLTTVNSIVVGGTAGVYGLNEV